MQRIRGSSAAPSSSSPASGAGVSDNDIQAVVRALPEKLDAEALPNGIVELVIEDLDGTTRELFDVHDGRIVRIEPGQCVPWASIAGTALAWAQALGPERDKTSLRPTGDQHLAQAVLVALPERP